MMMRMAMLSLAMLLPASAAAQVWWGPQVGYAAGAGLGVGGRAGTALGPLLGAEDDFISRLSGAAAFDYFFVDNPQSYWEINGLVTYPLEVEATARPYVGAGLTIGRLSTDGEVDGESVASGSESEIGLNALAGVRFPQLSVPLFVEVRLSTLRFVDAAGGESSGIYLTGGFLFGGR